MGKKRRILCLLLFWLFHRRRNFFTVVKTLRKKTMGKVIFSEALNYWKNWKRLKKNIQFSIKLIILIRWKLFYDFRMQLKDNRKRLGKKNVSNWFLILELDYACFCWFTWYCWNIELISFATIEKHHFAHIICLGAWCYSQSWLLIMGFTNGLCYSLYFLKERSVIFISSIYTRS